MGRALLRKGEEVVGSSPTLSQTHILIKSFYVNLASPREINLLLVSGTLKLSRVYVGMV